MRLAPFASRYAGNAMVCAIDHLAAEAGVATLRKGGSAADAAVAASAVLAVTNQHMCGMGGDLFALVHQDGLAPVALNSSGRAGSGADSARLRQEGHTFMPPTGDIRSVPVPGCWAHLTIEAACQAAYDRTEVLHEHADGAWLVSPGRLAPRRAAISPDQAAQLPGSYGMGDTIFLCAVDRDRTGVSLIQSNAGGFGSEMAEPSTGIFLQNRGVGFSLEAGHPAEYGPGRRPPHTLSPALVTSADERLQAVIGTMGGDSQPQILLQLLCRILCSAESVGDAIAAPRWVLSNSRYPAGFRTWVAGREIQVELEPNAPADWIPGLEARGHSVVRHDDFGFAAGHAHVIACRDGYLEGASDPRSLEGAAAGY